VRLQQRFSTAMRAIFGGIQSAGSEDGWLVRMIGGGKTAAGVHVSEWTAMHSAPVWAAVSLISDCIAMLPVEVIERSGDRRTKLTDHPVHAVLNGTSNPEMGATTTIGTMQMHALTWGNTYGEIERTGRGQVSAIWPLLPETTRPVVERTANGRRLVYRANVDRDRFDLPPENVVHVFGYSHDGINGISPIVAQRNAIGLALAMEEFGAKFFANDAKSGGFLMHPGKLNDKARENIRGSFGQEGDQGGLDNAHKVKILEEGMKFVPTSISPEDSQFLGSREFQLAEAARIFRVPLVLLQSLQGSTVWGTGVEQLMIGFVRWTLGPWLKRWETELTRKLLTPAERARGLTIKFNVNALMRGDSAARAAFYKAGIVDGWLTRNEVREKEDMNPLPGLDEPLMQANMMPAGALSEEGFQALASVFAQRRALSAYLAGQVMDSMEARVQ